MSDRSAQANLLFTIYVISTIALLISMTVWSGYLSWWWRHTDEPVATRVFIALLIMVIVSSIIVIWSIVSLIMFLMSRILHYSYYSMFLMVSILAHGALLMVPVLLWAFSMYHEDRAYYWFIWIIINMIIGGMTLSVLNQTRDVVVYDNRAHLVGVAV